MSITQIEDADVLIAARFDGRFDVVGDCWVWRGASTTGGYGQVSVEGRPQLAHRVALAIALGRPLTACALHHCDNPPCVRPSHLHEGDMKLNAHERSERGRSAVGERAGKAKLTRDQVLDVRRDRQEGMSFRKIAARYGVTHQSIRAICTGQTWTSAA